MSTLNLSASGLWCGALNHTFGARTLLVDAPGAGTRSTGKTTILSLLEAVTRGYVIELGKTAGEVAAYSPEGAIAYAVQVGGRSASGKLKLGAKKIATVPDCAVQTLSLTGLDGSPDATRKWLAENLRAGAEWSVDLVMSRFKARAKNKVQIAATTPLDAARAIVQVCRDAKNAAARIVEEAEAAARAHANAGAVEVTVAGSTGELEAKKQKLDSEIAALEQEYRDAFKGRVALDEARRKVELAKSDLQGFEQEPESLRPVDEGELQEMRARRAGLHFELERKKKELANYVDCIREAEVHLSHLQPTLERARGIEDMLLSGVCETCGSAVSAGTLTPLMNRVGTAQAVQASIDESTLNVAKWKQASSVLPAAILELQMSFTALDEKVQKAAEHNASVERMREQWELRKAAAAKLVRDREAALQALAHPREDAQIQGDLNVRRAERDKVLAALLPLRQRDAAAKQAEAVRANGEKARADVATWTEDLEVASALRDEVLASAMTRLHGAVKQAAALVEADGIVSVGDADTPPELGFRRDGKTVLLSGRERVIFRAALAAALLEQAQAPRERRLLLIEADPVPSALLPGVLEALTACDVGHVVVAHCERPAAVPSGWDLIELCIPGEL